MMHVINKEIAKSRGAKKVEDSNDFKIGYLYQEDDMFFVVVDLNEKTIEIESIEDSENTASVVRELLVPADLEHIYEIGKLENHPEYFL